jgi:hypothetical protein
MRKKPGYRELCFYLTEEQYAALERYWRHQTTDRHITTTAVTLLVEALQAHQQHSPPPQQRET